jgi:hypothetical protein
MQDAQQLSWVFLSDTGAAFKERPLQGRRSHPFSNNAGCGVASGNGYPSRTALHTIAGRDDAPLQATSGYRPASLSAFAAPSAAGIRAQLQGGPTEPTDTLTGSAEHTSAAAAGLASDAAGESTAPQEMAPLAAPLPLPADRYRSMRRSTVILVDQQGPTDSQVRSLPTAQLCCTSTSALQTGGEGGAAIPAARCLPPA